MKRFDNFLELLAGVAILTISLFTLSSPAGAQSSAALDSNELDSSEKEFTVVELPNYDRLKEIEASLVTGCVGGVIINHGLPASGFPPNEEMIATLKPYPAFYPSSAVRGEPCVFEQKTYLHLKDHRYSQNQVNFQEECVELQDVIRADSTGVCVQGHRILRRCCRKP